MDKKIDLPRLKDGSWKSRKNLCIFRLKIVISGKFYVKHFHKKQFNNAQIVLHCEWQQV